MAIARVLATANEAAAKNGIKLEVSLVSIAEESAPPDRVWRIHYGPREFVNRRGGDLIVLVDEQTAEVRRMIRGQ